MSKPRGRGTSTGSKRSLHASTGRGRAQPGATAGRGAEVKESAKAARRNPKQAARPAGSRAWPRKAKSGALLERAAEARPAAPRRRAAEGRADEPGSIAPPKRRRAAKAARAAQPPRLPELDWDDAPAGSCGDTIALRWAARAEELFARLAAHGAAQHEYRADLKEGRFVWLSPDGRVSAEARAQVLCSWSRATSAVAMAWADPLVRSAAVGRIDEMPDEQDDVDEEGAWRIAMTAADACCAAYLYRVPAPHAWYFLALHDLTFSPERPSFHPGAPVGLVLRAIGDAREAIASRAEPAEVIRERLRALGSSLFHQARYAYRDTDWVARLDRTGTRLLHLAKRIPRVSFGAIAAGQYVSEWLERELAIELIEALSLIEDEWSLFG